MDDLIILDEPPVTPIGEDRVTVISDYDFGFPEEVQLDDDLNFDF